MIIAPLSGKFSNHFGNGLTMVLGSLTLGAGLLVSHIPHLGTVAVSMVLACAGFFAVHASAVGGMNRRLPTSRGRANSLYILWYYVGGSVGITVTGHFFKVFGWSGVTGAGLCMVAALLGIGIHETRSNRAQPSATVAR